MATGRVTNGGRRADFYSVTIGTTQTTLTSTTPVYTCLEQISSDGANDDNGVRTWSLDQIQSDSAFFTFCNTYAPGGGAGIPEDLTMEDGELIAGASSTGTTLALSVRGALISGGTDDGKRLSWHGLVKISKTSGSVNFSGLTYVKPTLQATTTAITADLVMPSTVLTSYCTTPATVTLSSTTNTYGKFEIR